MRKISLLILILSFSSCALFADKGQPLEELAAKSKELEQFRIRAGDSIDVQVWGEPRVSGEVTVRSDGRLTLPLVGEVFVAGKTPEEVAKEVEKSLAEYIPAASVSASVTERAPIAYYLSGNFQRPGEYRSDKDIKLLQAIATGGGFAPFADESSITIIRPNIEGTGDLRYYLDYNDVVDGSQPNPILQDGDTITVQ